MKSKKLLFAQATIISVIGIGTMVHALPQTFSKILPVESLLSTTPKTVDKADGGSSPSEAKVQNAGKNGGLPVKEAEKVQAADAPVSEIPEPVIYLFLFREVAAFEAKAVEVQSRGENGANYRTVYQRTAHLTAEQSEFLRKIAVDCAAEVKVKDEAARQIGDRLRSEYQAQLNVGTAPTVPPTSPELQELQRQRDEVVLKYRDLLRENFAETFPRFQHYVENHITSNIKTNAKGGGAGPAPRMERLNDSKTPVTPAVESNGEDK